MEPWHKIPTRAYLGHAAFYEDETRYEVFPYADQRGNLSFIVRVKVKWVLCYKPKYSKYTALNLQKTYCQMQGISGYSRPDTQGGGQLVLWFCMAIV